MATTNSSFLFGFWAEKMSERWRRRPRRGRPGQFSSRPNGKKGAKNGTAKKGDIFEGEALSRHCMPKMCKNYSLRRQYQLLIREGASWPSWAAAAILENAHPKLIPAESDHGGEAPILIL